MSLHVCVCVIYQSQQSGDWSLELGCCTTEKNVYKTVHHHSNWDEEMFLTWLVDFGWNSYYL
jgi:hypothetical protein